jgi:hypothetical protein
MECLREEGKTSFRREITQFANDRSELVRHTFDEPSSRNRIKRA